MADHPVGRPASPRDATAAARRGRPWIMVSAFLRAEGALLFGALTSVAFYVFADALIADLAPDLKTVALFLWLFAAMLWCAFGVVRHADCLAEMLG